MINYLNILKKCPLFFGILENEIEPILVCLSAKTKIYQKDQFVFRSGDHISSVGIVLSGSVHIIKEDFWGNRSILSEAVVGQLFGETYACVQTQPLIVSVIAAEDTEIMFLDAHSMMTSCSSACEFHLRLIRNLIGVLAEKNLMLTQKMEHLTKRTTREKLLSYLSAESQKNSSGVFEIPFNRQQLADFLSVDRSAMSSELSKLRSEGILAFYKNTFELKENRHAKHTK